MSKYILTKNGELYNADELMHYGVPGMKWGIRRYQNKDGSLTKAGKKRYDKIVAWERDMIIKDLKGRHISLSPYRIRVRDMNIPKSKMRQAVRDWSDAKNAKIRDDYRSGKLSKKKLIKKKDRLSEETERMLKEIKERRHIYNRGKTFVNNVVRNDLMGAQAHQQFVNQMHTQQAIQEANRTASLGLTGGTNPFMFG